MARVETHEEHSRITHTIELFPLRAEFKLSKRGPPTKVANSLGTDRLSSAKWTIETFVRRFAVQSKLRSHKVKPLRWKAVRSLRVA